MQLSYLLLVCMLHLDLLRGGADVEGGVRGETAYWTAGRYWWEHYPLAHKECSECGQLSNFLCDTEIGSAIPEANISSINAADVCIRFHSSEKPITPEEVYKKLGPNAVINFVGDSNTRNLFVEAVGFFGHPHWMHNLHEEGKKWKNKDTRHTIDHTYLCTGPLPPYNLTLSFLWSRFIHHPKFYLNRPWSRCSQACRFGGEKSGIQKCDDSDPEGANSR